MADRLHFRRQFFAAFCGSRNSTGYSRQAGASQLLNHAALPSPTELVSRFVFWVAWLGFIMLGISVLGIGGLQEHVDRFFIFLPRLVVALLILFFGLLVASFFSRAALLAAVNANLPSPRLAERFCAESSSSSSSCRWCSKNLGVADQTMLLAFGIALAQSCWVLRLLSDLGEKIWHTISWRTGSCGAGRWTRKTSPLLSETIIKSRFSYDLVVHLNRTTME